MTHNRKASPTVRIPQTLAAILVALAVTIGLAPPANAAPVNTISSNIPKSAGGSRAQQYVTLNQVAHAVDQTPRGQTITISMYSQNRYRNRGQLGASVMYRIERAVRRGVHVRYVTWTPGNGKEMRRLTRAIHRKHDRLSWLKVCRGACKQGGRAGNGIHHTKAFTFTATGGRRWVTMILSGNLTRSSAEDQWNDADTIVGNRPIFDAVTRDIVAMRADRWQGVRRAVRSGPWTLYFFPQPRKPQDPVLSRLRQIKCRYTTGPRRHRVKHRSWVLVNMAFWSGYRNKYTRELVHKQRQGCQVRIVYSGKITSPAVKRILKRGHVPRWDANVGPRYTHAKSVYMMGVFNRSAHLGNKPIGVNLTGSANLTRAGQRLNDDYILETRSTSYYYRHARTFNILRAHSRRVR